MGQIWRDQFPSRWPRPVVQAQVWTVTGWWWWGWTCPPTCSSAGCMCAMGVFPTLPEVTTQGKKPFKSYLWSDASGKCVHIAERQQRNECVQALWFVQSSRCHTTESNAQGGGVNKAINNLLQFSNVRFSVAFNCFCKAFYASLAPVPWLLPF